MLYVITEDRNSGREFWKKVMETFLTSEEYSIVPFPKDKVGGDKTGNFSLNEQVDIVLTYAKAGDSIFIAFDNKEADKNKEHFADALLYQATHGIKHGLFSISKERNKSLKCWILDCESMQEHSNNKSSNFPSEYMCKNCKFCKKNCNSMEKPLDLDDKSLIKNEQLSIHKLKSKFIVKI